MAARAVVFEVADARKGVFEVAGRLDSGVHPLVGRAVPSRSIEPQHVGLEESLVGRQRYANAPVGAQCKVGSSNRATDAAVGIFRNCVIDPVRAPRRVADDAEIHLDSARSPRPAHCHVAKLHHMVEVDEFASGPLVYGTPYLAPHTGHDPQFDVVVLHFDHLPFLHAAFGRVTVVTVVRVNASEIGNLLGGGVGVGEHFSFDHPDRRTAGCRSRRISAGCLSVAGCAVAKRRTEAECSAEQR